MKKTLEQAVSRLRQLGTVLQENDRPAEALEAWKIAYNLMDDEVAEHPDGLWLVLAIAEQHYAKRDFETALVFYDEAYGIMPDDNPGHELLLSRIAECNQELGHADRALEFLMRATIERSVTIERDGMDWEDALKYFAEHTEREERIAREGLHRRPPEKG